MQKFYFVIDEKNNSIELTEKGIELVSKTAEDAKFFGIARYWIRNS